MVRCGAHALCAPVSASTEFVARGRTVPREKTPGTATVGNRKTEGHALPERDGGPGCPGCVAYGSVSGQAPGHGCPDRGGAGGRNRLCAPRLVRIGRAAVPRIRPNHRSKGLAMATIPPGDAEDVGGHQRADVDQRGDPGAARQDFGTNLEGGCPPPSGVGRDTAEVVPLCAGLHGTMEHSSVLRLRIAARIELGSRRQGIEHKPSADWGREVSARGDAAGSGARHPATRRCLGGAPSTVSRMQARLLIAPQRCPGQHRIP